MFCCIKNEVKKKRLWFEGLPEVQQVVPLVKPTNIVRLPKWDKK